jgi:hypothetical protein
MGTMPTHYAKRIRHGTGSGGDKIQGVLYLTKNGRKVARIRVKQKVSLDDHKLKQLQRMQQGDEFQVEFLD